MDSEGEKPLACSAFAFGLSTPVHPFDVKRGPRGATGAVQRGRVATIRVWIALISTAWWSETVTGSPG